MLTFVMPTINGFDRVNLVCSWLHYQHFGGHLIVVDGSQKTNDTLSKKWNFVKYIHIPGCSSPNAQFHGFQNVETPFACLIGDDDLPILDGCDKCINFLLRNNAYGAAHGSSSFFDFDSTQNIFKKKNKLDWRFCLKTFFSGRYDQHSDYSADSDLERLIEFRTNYIVSLFCIARTSLAKKANNEIISEIKDVHLSEILSSFGYIICDKIKKLPDLYLMRGLGKHRPNASASTSRHFELDIECVNQRTIEYLHSVNVDERYRRVCLALLIDTRLKDFLKRSSITHVDPQKKISTYCVQQLRRLRLCTSPSNLVKFSFLHWFKKNKKDSQL